MSDVLNLQFEPDISFSCNLNPGNVVNVSVEEMKGYDPEIQALIDKMINFNKSSERKIYVNYDEAIPSDIVYKIANKLTEIKDKLWDDKLFKKLVSSISWKLDDIFKLDFGGETILCSLMVMLLWTRINSNWKLNLLLISDKIEKDVKDLIVKIDAISLSVSDNSEKNNVKNLFYDPNIDLKQKEIVESVLKLYKDYFVWDTLEVFVSADLINQSTNNGDFVKNILARAESWKIYLNPLNLDNLDNLYNIVKHELFHTIKPKKNVIFTENIPLESEFIYGNHGLSLLIELSDWKKVKFTKIEEACAEFVASSLEKGYVVNDPSYYAVWTFMKKCSEELTLFTAKDIVNYQANNNIYWFISCLLKKHVDNLTVDDLLNVMTIFDNLFSLPSLYIEKENKIPTQNELDSFVNDAIVELKKLQDWE